MPIPKTSRFHPSNKQSVGVLKDLPKINKMVRKDEDYVPRSFEKVGINKMILKCLRRADKENPISKADILEVLEEAFPDRPAKGMAKTINGQICWHLPRKGIKVFRTEDGKGFWCRKLKKKIR